MTNALRQITIRKLRQPTDKDLNQDIEWICNSLGFITSRDQDKTAFLILKALIQAAKRNKGLTSEELSREVTPTIGAVIYHLKRLMKSGLVVKLDGAYELRMNSLLSTITEIEKESDSTLQEIKKIASEVDDQVGLNHRE